MKQVIAKLTKRQIQQIVSAHKLYLVEEGGCSFDEVEDVSIETVFNYALYCHLDFIGSAVTDITFLVGGEES